MKAFETTKIGENKGRPRLWLEGFKAIAAGFLPGVRFNVRKDEARTMLVLEQNEHGDRIVSRKLKGEKEIPIIDINSAEVLSIFEGFNAVRIIAQGTRIVILPMAVEIAKRERLERLTAKLANGEPLAVGSVAHGGGVLTHALHTGLKEGGVATTLAFANEIRPELLEHAKEHNDAWSANTIPLGAPLQEVAFDTWLMDHLPKVEVYEGGIPCSGASVAGRGRNGAGHAEAHPEVGHLIVAYLAVLARVQPAVAVLENVPPYAKSTTLLQRRHNLLSIGKSVVVITSSCDDRHGLGKVTSRMGPQCDAQLYQTETEFAAHYFVGVDELFIDEAQFLTRKQVQQIHADLCAAHGMRVSCFGLRTDFQGNPFEGSVALLALADELHELSTFCRCGRKATMNQRIDGHGLPVREGLQLEIGGDNRYRPVCPSCFYR